MNERFELNINKTRELAEEVASLFSNRKNNDLISRKTLEKVSKIFIGDEGEYYNRKTGPQIVAFSNDFFGLDDVYGQGFPTRYLYFTNILSSLNLSSLEAFFIKILSVQYLKTEYYELNKVIPTDEEIFKKQNQIIELFNLYLANDMYELVVENGDIELEVLKKGLFIAEGGFAEVYFENKNKNSVFKMLKPDYINDKFFVDMFKREFNITNELNGIKGIMPVSDFVCDIENKNISYKMPYFENNLENYLSSNKLLEEKKDYIIRNIIEIMSNVHLNKKIHRDLKPSNIYIYNEEIYISDFGIGKRVNVPNTTFTTSISAGGIGTELYMAPEQSYDYKNTSFPADVFSLGRIINKIMCDNPMNNNHKYKKIVIKATNESPDLRYKNAKEMLDAIDLCLEQISKDQIKGELLPKLLKNISSEDENEIIFDNLTGKEICDLINNYYTIISDALIKYMVRNPENEREAINKIKDSFISYDNNYEKYDRIADFCIDLIVTDNINDKNTPAKIVSYIGDDRGVRRFKVQDKIKKLITEINDQEIVKLLKNKGPLYKFN